MKKLIKHLLLRSFGMAMLLFSICTAPLAACAQEARLPDSLITLQRSASTLYQKHYVAGQILNYWYVQGNMPQFAATLENLMSLALQLKNDTFLMTVESDMGSYYSDQGDYRIAMEMLERSATRAQKLKDSNLLFQNYNNISVIYFNLSDYQEAVKYLRKIEKILKPISNNNRPTYVNFYLNLAGSYQRLNMLDSCSLYLEKANQLLLTDKNDNPNYSYFTAFLYAAYGELYEKYNQNDLAEVYFNKSLKLSDSISDKMSFIQTNNGYASFLSRNQQPEKAKMYAGKAFAAAKNAGFKLDMMEAAQILHKSFHGLKQKDSAYYYAQVLLDLKDSIFSQQSLHQIENLKFSAQLRETEEEQLKKEEKQNNERTIAYIGILLAITLLSVFFIFISQSIFAGPKLIKFLGIVILLLAFEFISLIIHPMLGELTHHSPYVMLLIMAALGAILIPLHTRLEHWMLKTLIAKNRKIRLATAQKTVKELSGDFQG